MGQTPKYAIADIFRSLQGEGTWCGVPMTFLRFAGCSVTGCHIRWACDEFPWKARARLDLAEIVKHMRALCPTGIVCITGGEPTDHQLGPVVEALHAAGFRVHLETSGVRSVDGIGFDWITVSPKVLTPEGLAQRSGGALKLVVRAEWSTAETWEIAGELETTTKFDRYYMQPMTIGEGAANLDAVIAVLHEPRNADGRWALSVQSHRTWSVK